MSTLRAVGDADFPALPVIDGPWNSDVWLMERPLRYETAGDRPCAVDECDRPAGKALGDKPRPEDILCVPHRRRRAKLPQLVSVSEFIQTQSGSSPIRLARGARTRLQYFHPVDFTRVHPRFAEELRYVTSIRVNRNIWRAPEYVNDVLRAAIHLGAHVGAVHVADLSGILEAPHPAPPLSDSPASISSRAVRNLRLALPQMLTVLEIATTDPWENLIWHPGDLRQAGVSSAAKSSISWHKVTCPWFREGARLLAQQDLQSGARAWSTVKSYVRAGSILSAFMDEQSGPLAPHEISHQVILELISWLRDEDSVREDFSAVNVLVNLLYRLRAEDITPALPDTVFLRRGQNPIRKSRKPKPFPEDLLKQMDQLISDADAWPDDMQLLMRLFRATGPRASEALELPPNCVTYVEERGYTLEYYMSKVDDWRRIPLPPNLGKDLVEQQQRVLRDHPDSPFLFPYFGPAPRTNSLAYSRALYSPWPYGRFTGVVWAIFRKAGITSSAQSGEVLTGAQLHRFRHSIATGLLNEGWTQYEVQKFLGHKSPTMMQSYAEIHDDTLRDKYNDYLRNSVNIEGERSTPLSDTEVDVERLRNTMVRATLPNGYCTLPEKQTCTYLPSPCLSCFFFKTTPTFLPIHIRQRDDSLREIDLAREEGRERAVDAHTQTVARLDIIIDALSTAAAEDIA